MDTKAKIESAVDTTVARAQAQVKSMGRFVERLAADLKLGSATPPQPKNLKEWVAQEATARGDESLRSWVMALPATDLNTLNWAVAGFAKALRFDPAWLLSADLAHSPALKQALSDTVYALAQACRQGQAVEEDIAVYVAYMAWRKNPGKCRDLTQKVYARLYETGALKPTSEFFTLSDKARRAHVLQTLQSFHETNGPAFMSALKEVLGAKPGVALALAAPVEPNLVPATA